MAKSAAADKKTKPFLKPGDIESLFAVRPLILMGVGSELRGDDAWTFEVIKKLQQCKSTEISFIWASTMPENFIKSISQIRPKRVIIIDSADIGAKPGAVRILQPAQIADEYCLSHRMPLKLNAEMIKERAGSDVYFLLMQPKNIEFGFGLTPDIKRSMEALAKQIKKALKCRIKT